MKELESVIGKIHSLEREIERLKRVEMPIVSVIGTWQDWTPTFIGWISGTPTGTYRYCVIGKTCIAIIDMSAGTSSSTAAGISLPPVTKKSGVAYSGVNGMAMNNGVVLTAATRWYMDPIDTYVLFHTDMGSGVWTASGTKRVRALVIFETE